MYLITNRHLCDENHYLQVIEEAINSGIKNIILREKDMSDDDLTDLPSKPGVYIIVSFKTKFIYPIGQSKVIYIGKTDNIQRRLKEHQRNLINAINDRFNECWHLDRYNYMRYHGAKVYYYTCRGYQESKDLESSIIESFYDRYGSIPVANGARSFRCVKD